VIFGRQKYRDVILSKHSTLLFFFDFFTTTPALKQARAFFQSRKSIFIFKLDWATLSVVNFYSTIVVKRDL
jgi:hypothetical protein